MDARLVAVETSLDTRYAHPRLTALASRAPGQDSTLGTDERQALLNEAAVCVERMRGRRDVDGNIILDAHASDVSIEYVAAGLALPCGHVYHSDCIHQWINRRAWCPVCREAL